MSFIVINLKLVAIHELVERVHGLDGDISIAVQFLHGADYK